MSGHGWVTPLPSGAKARCGGLRMCSACLAEHQALYEEDERIEPMRVIYKYPLTAKEIGEVVEIPMPMGAKVLSTGMQSGGGVIWALVDDDPDLPKVTRSFIAVETGKPFAAITTSFVGTIMVADGYYVLHVFEVAGG